MPPALEVPAPTLFYACLAALMLYLLANGLALPVSA